MITTANQSTYKHDHCLDVTRGLTTKFAFALGFPVHAYVDEPGSYYDNQCGKIPDAVAARAGFDVAHDRALRAKIDARKAIAVEITDSVQHRGGPAIVTENSRYRLIALGEELGQILYADTGHKMTELQPMAAAKALFAALDEDA